MRTINISNSKARNAQVGFELQPAKPSVSYVRCDGKKHSNIRLLKSTARCTVTGLTSRLGEDLTDELIASDPEIDIERVGMILQGVKRVFLSDNGSVACQVKREQVFYTPEGIEKESHPYHTPSANINTDRPLRWTGKLIPKTKAARMFVFVRKYQLRHINGLTYDFLFDMARQLEEQNCLMLIGAGEKGIAPLVIAGGGTPYRAFLEGRTDGDKYCLILHLTNLELKPIC